jgi:hypothetical protein
MVSIIISSNVRKQDNKKPGETKLPPSHAIDPIEGDGTRNLYIFLGILVR